MILRVSIISGVLGLLLLAWSAILPPYKNQALVEEARSGYPSGIDASRAASEAYWAVRDAQLTPKFTLQNYGATLVALALLFVAMRQFLSVDNLSALASINTPTTRWKVVALGMLAAVLTPIAYVASLLLGAARDEFPPWADSLGIPLAGVPFIFFFLVICAGLFSAVGIVSFRKGIPLMGVFRASSRPPLLWSLTLGIPLAISVAFTCLTLAAGDFLFFVPFALWTVFFLVLLAGKQRLPANPPHRHRPLRGGSCGSLGVR
jgi:hypothetical protein